MSKGKIKGGKIMEDFNKGLLSGRISKMTVRRVDSKSEASGKIVIANINLSVNYYNHKKKEKEAIFFPVTILGKDAEYMEKYMSVGDELYVIGEWRPNEWTGKNGEKHRELYLQANEIKAGQKKGGRSAENYSPAVSSENNKADKQSQNDQSGLYQIDNIEDNDLPF